MMGHGGIRQRFLCSCSCFRPRASRLMSINPDSNKSSESWLSVSLYRFRGFSIGLFRYSLSFSADSVPEPTTEISALVSSPWLEG